MRLEFFDQQQVFYDKIFKGISRYLEITERLFHRHHVCDERQLLLAQVLIIDKCPFYVT